MSTLYIVATPIGNLEDMTYRAERVLREVSLIACEDTRTTKKLLEHYAIGTPQVSFHAHSGDMKIEKIIEQLKEGNDVALVTDAGTPAISDPGSRLVSEVREALPEVVISPIPGASALTTALSASGLKGSEFLFLGFLPHKKGRQTAFEEIAASERTVVFYESTHRIMKAIESLKEHCPDKKVTIARELTKLYEEVLSGTAEDLEQLLLSDSNHQKGEFVVIVHGH